MFNNPIYESAFKELDLLCELDFNLNSDSADEIKDFRSEEDFEKVVDVIDLDAENDEELATSNIGKIILQCPCCETIVCKDSNEVELPDDVDEETYVQVGTYCPVCFSEEGYKIIGKVAPYEEVEVTVEPKDTNSAKEDSDTAVNSTDWDAEMETDFDVEEDKDDIKESLSEATEINTPIGSLKTNTIDNAVNSVSGVANNAVNNVSGVANNIVDHADDVAGAAAALVPLFADNEAELDQTDGARVKNKVCPDCGKSPRECKKDEHLTEGINDILLETDTDRISIHSEIKAENGEEMIAPLDFQAANEIVDALPEDDTDADYLDDVETIENTAELEPVETSDVEADLNQFDEESFDGLGEAYFRSVYDNVKSYITESVFEKDNKLIVEGAITFNSGNTRKTSFILEGDKLSLDGTCTMLVENRLITPGVKGYTLAGKISDGKFITEAFNYNYKQNGTLVKGSIKIR